MQLDPNDVLSATLPTRTRRSAGAFFTTPALAKALVAPFARDLEDPATSVLDPACGAGDLLLAAASHFGSNDDPQSRLHQWQQRIHGRDLVEEFVLSARLRLVWATKASHELSNPLGFFPSIRRECSLSSTSRYEFATHVLLNPPYTLVPAPAECQWRTGRVNAAALFMEHIVQQCTPGTRIGAVLPDVLRSGTGYEEWRRLIARSVHIDKVQAIGRFARWADVDVFLIHCRRGDTAKARSSRSRWALPRSTTATLGTRCIITVGPVVDYRSPARGQWHPYLTVDNAPAHGRVRSDTLRARRFQGRVVLPPFLVARRTSRANDLQRVVCTVVTGKRAVAVENHLIVLQPHLATVAECDRIARALSSDQSSGWLNARIRCRHLTTSALRDLPWHDK
jgi:hypothetical protein